MGLKNCSQWFWQDAIDPKSWAAHRHAFGLKKDFAAYFERECAPPMFAAVMALLTNAVPNKVYISPRVTVNLLRVTGHAVRRRDPVSFRPNF